MRRVQATKPRTRLEVTADGDGLVGHAGAALLVELAERLGLPAELDRWAGRGQPGRARHRAGKVLADLAVMLADGGDCLSDLAALRDQPGLFGPVASTPTAWAGPRAPGRRWRAGAGRAAAGSSAGPSPSLAGRGMGGGAAGDRPGRHPDHRALDKQGAAGTYKGGFGFHPLAAWLDRGDGTGEPLAAVLRPGNAAANTAPTRSTWSTSPLPSSLARHASSSRSWSAPTRPAPPMGWSTTSAHRVCGSRSGSTWTAECGPRSWRSRPTPGVRPWMPMVAIGTALRSPSWPAWTCRRRAGRRAPGRSAGGSGPTPAPS